MPNYKIATGIKEEITNRARALLGTRMEYALAQMPIPVERIPTLAMKHDHLHMLQVLKDEGFTLDQSSALIIGVIRDRCPGVTRHVIAKLELPEKVFKPAGGPQWYSQGQFLDNERVYIWDYGDLAPAMATWANHVAREFRVNQMVFATVKQALRLFTTTATLTAAWPFLPTLLQNKEWTTRFRNGVRNPKKYGPSPTTVADWGKSIEASTTWLSGAEMLPAFKLPDGAIQTTLLDVEALPNDRIYQQ